MTAEITKLEADKAIKDKNYQAAIKKRDDLKKQYDATLLKYNEIKAEFIRLNDTMNLKFYHILVH